MSPERFHHLLELVGPLITKKPCRSRKVISPHERLMVTLRYLAEGEAQQSQSFNFRMGKATVSKIVRETCDTIWTALYQTYLKIPTSVEEWKKIAVGFEKEWNFPHCLGAIDGKHIMIECPKNAGSAYYNYKNFHSIVLLAICDANYCFTFVDIGDYGSTNDASILANSAFGQTFDKGPETLKIPKPCSYKHLQKLPFVLISH
ncbi:putative nuclease HARBI1 [Xenia sp. Carnegie-2017]|uniref:putative nuclease HARBI1 n=1 Tax=Xenia sp. Carnegie-2017 TaxID=2897299 RepID=UPI001F03DF01|nr:putative nuclease HARBI1 [Xenia sp. Carnegie-2017]